MKHKFIIERTETHNENDCWAIALSKALNEPYDKVYKRFKDMKTSSNAVDNDIIKGYLKTKGYSVIKIGMDLIDALRIYDKSNGILYGMENTEKEYHIVYVKDHTIYESETVTDDMLWWYITQYTCMWIAIKLDAYE